MKTFTTLFLLLITSLIFAQNNALDFNTDDYVAISSFFGLDGLSESIECWVHLPSTSEKGTFLHIGNHDSGYGVGVGASTFDNYGNNLILLYDMRTWISTAKSIGTGWHHIAVTLNTSGNCTPYIDGIEVVASTGSQAITPTGGSTIGTISQSNGVATRTLSSGTIDEVRVWSDVRTQTEIRANMYKELAGDETGLVAYYKLNETDGTGTAADASSNTNNGTLKNMTNNEWQTSSAFFGPKTV